jgi:hypothetical protein
MTKEEYEGSWPELVRKRDAEIAALRAQIGKLRRLLAAIDGADNEIEETSDGS